VKERLAVLAVEEKEFLEKLQMEEWKQIEASSLSLSLSL
jgi:hypothetical protein